MSKLVCRHGSLARSCTICDLEEDVKDLLHTLRWAMKQVRYTDGGLGRAEEWAEMYNRALALLDRFEVIP